MRPDIEGLEGMRPAVEDLEYEMDGVPAAAVGDPVREEVVDLPSLPGFERKVGAPHGQEHPRAGAQRDVDAMRHRMAASVVRVPADVVAGFEPHQRNRGMARFGEAVTRRGLSHDREQQPLPDHPHRRLAKFERRAVAIDEPEHDVLRVLRTEVPVHPCGALPTPYLLRQPFDVRSQFGDVHLPQMPHPGRLADPRQTASRRPNRLCPPRQDGL